jgi:hypothetical protein
MALPRSAPAGAFEAGSFLVVEDREGVTVAGGDTIDVERTISPESLGLADDDDLGTGLGRALSRLLGREVADEDGIYDFAVRDPSARDRVVASLVLAVSDDDDAVELSLEVATDVSAKEIVSHIVAAIAKASAIAEKGPSPEAS